MTPNDLLSDFAKNRKWGSIELVYRNGVVVFFKAVETFMPHNEKNSMREAPRMENGADHRDFSTNY